MKERKISFKSQGQKVVGILTEPDNPRRSSIIIVPGFRCTKEDYKEESRLFCKNGFRTLTLDLRGRGESDGIFEEITLDDSISDVNLAIRFLKTDVGIYGESYGGLVAINACENPRIKSLVLISPVVDIKTIHGGNAYEDAMTKGVFEYDTHWKGIIDVYSKKFVENAAKHNSYDNIKKTNSPVLIFHGEKDKVVPFSDVKKLFDEIEGEKKLITYPDCGHSIDSHWEEISEETVNWFKKWLE